MAESVVSKYLIFKKVVFFADNFLIMLLYWAWQFSLLSISVPKYL